MRLVFAPEESIAFFGGDPDNFTYPRFDLDNAFVRIYNQGKPLVSPNYLKFARTGVKDGDLAFVSGNPGRTERQDTLAQLAFIRDYQQPFVLNLFSELRGVLSEYATKNAEAARTSTELMFGIENSLKAIKGRQMALTQGPLMAQKQADETAFRAKIAADPKLAASGSTFDAITMATTHQRDIYQRMALLERLPQQMSTLLGYAVGLNRFAVESQKPDGQRLEEYSTANAPALRMQLTSPAPVYPALEKTVLVWWLTKLREYLGTTDADTIAILGKQSPDGIASLIVGKTQLADPKLRAKLVAGGAAAINASQDPLLVFARTLDAPARAVRADYENNVKAVITKNAGIIASARFAADGTGSYPDATFSLRLSYGTVAGYTERGQTIAPTTNFAGAYAHATGRDPFKLPKSWLSAEKSVNPSTNLNFVTTNDIIGGNSGSPVIGRNGDAIGLIFDGNIQSLGGDFGYDGTVNRAVAVDTTALTQALTNIYHFPRLAHELIP